MKLYNTYHDRGLEIVFSVTKDDAKKNASLHFFRSKKLPFPLTRNGKSRVKRKTIAMPASAVFDAKGNVAGAGNAQSLQTTAADLMKTRRHWLVGGRKFKKLGKFADLLGGRIAYGALLKKLKPQLEKKDIGELAAFHDPSGHVLFLWQPPPSDGPGLPLVAPLVEHFERCLRRLGPTGEA